MKKLELWNNIKQLFISNNGKSEIYNILLQALKHITKYNTTSEVEEEYDDDGQKMNIVLITDEAYLVPTCVTISSLLKTQPADTHIFVICDDPEGKLSHKFLEIDNPKKIEITTVPGSNKYSELKTSHPYISKAALQKFSIPELIHKNKALYMDVDIVVKDSLSDLYSSNIDNLYAAVCEDLICKYMEKDNRRIGNPLYFNSGVMLLNLKKMRKEKITDKLIKYFKKDKLCKYMDQDSFNCVFRKKVKYADIIYNYFPMYGKYIGKFKELSADQEPIVIHYAGEKPWKKADVALANVWLSLYEELFSGSDFLDGKPDDK